MPTKTPRKLPPRIGKSTQKVVLSQPLRDAFCELASMTDADSKGERGKKFIAGLETILTQAAISMGGLKERPLTAHVIAALEDISHAAEKLAPLLKDQPHEVLKLFDMSVPLGQVWVFVNEIHINAEVRLSQLKGKETRGEYSARSAELTKSIDQALLTVFKKYAFRPAPADKREFIRLSRVALNPQAAESKAQEIRNRRDAYFNDDD